MATVPTRADVEEQRRALMAAAHQLAASGVMSKSLHANWSVRLPGSDQIVMTSGGSFAGLKPQDLAILDLDGNLIEGEVAPIFAEIIQMHTRVYKARPDVGSVLHTHSPFATAFAVASKPIECWSEAMARSGITEPVPIAAYAPRGSPESVQNIIDAIRPQSRAVLLENHGILAFAQNLQMTMQVQFAVEEAAETGLYAMAIGKPKLIPPEMAQAAIMRAEDFARAGTQRR
ncbi:MAG TPA: class II aldolase/adducin family protein [Dehalococcoidia bacterium]|nr:class II aldolase/adducin family protein [Dehalococcoidia bacterium]